MTGAPAKRAGAAESVEPEEETVATPAAAGVDYGPLDRRLGYLLRRAQIAVFRDFFATFADYDIRPAQYSLLAVIEANPGLKQGAVGEALGIKRPNVVAMIDDLEERGHVLRGPSAGDRRSYALTLTPKGARLIAELHAVSERHEQRLIAAIGRDAYDALFTPLKTLAALAPV
jgi:DNA-binding MarR family transcriptional regulator